MIYHNFLQRRQRVKQLLSCCAVALTMVGSSLNAQQPKPSAIWRDSRGVIHNHGPFVRGRDTKPRPPRPLDGITLTASQQSQLQTLNTQFTATIRGHDQRRKALGLSAFDSSTKVSIQASQQHLFSDVRGVLTPAQRVVFDRNQSKRKAYLEQRKTDIAAQRILGAPRVGSVLP